MPQLSSRLASWRGAAAVSLLPVTILLAPTSFHLALVLFTILVVKKAALISRPDLFAQPRHAALVGATAITGVWMLLRVAPPWGTGLHTFYHPDYFYYPVTVLDYVPFMLAFLLLSARGFSTSEVRAAAWAIVWLIPILATLAVGERFLFWEGSYTFDVAGFELFDVNFVQRKGGRTRAGLEGNNVLGTYAMFAGLVTAVLFLAERRRLVKGRLRRLLVLGCFFPASVFVLMMSGARTCLVAFSLLLILIALAEGRRVRATVAIAFVVVGGVFFMAEGRGPVSHQLRKAFPRSMWRTFARSKPLKAQIAFRSGAFGCAADLTKERPLLGWGIGKMPIECEERLDKFVNHAHNIFLQLTSEIGIPFGLLAAGTMGWIFLVSVRHWKNCPGESSSYLASRLFVVPAAAFLVSQTQLAVLHSWGLEIVVWLTLAIAFASARSGPSSPW